MSREIRITIDDDEVFERLRRRKEERDLSWEEALRRGLGEDPRGRGDGGEFSFRGGPGPSGELSPFDPDFGERLRRRIQRQTPGPDPTEDERGGSPNPLDPGFGDWIGEQVERAVGGSIEAATATLDAEIERLEGAEDATLVFEALDEPREVPLRVDIRSGPDGLDVTVVAVRQGKGTAGMNQFEEADRMAVARHLADGGTASLRIGDGTVSYDVVPSLEWGRDADGTPTVTDVEIVRVDL